MKAAYSKRYWRRKMQAVNRLGYRIPCQGGGTGAKVVFRGVFVKAFGRLDGGDGIGILWTRGR